MNEKKHQACTTVGIIANPESGKDIRRLVSHASVFDNMEKVNIAERILLTLQAFGIRKVLVMPETFGIVMRAINAIGKDLKIDFDFLPIEVLGNWKDTYNATKQMKDKVSAIIVIGGDGTNRIVAKACGDIPIMPLSTGTNNVHPYMMEATIAAEAVASIVMGFVTKEEGTYKRKRLEIFQEDKLKDIALIDIAVTMHSYVGTKAIWKPELLKEIVVTECSPYNIGLSSIAGNIKEIKMNEDHGFYVEIGDCEMIKAAIAPGVLREIGIKNFRILNLGEKLKLKNIPSLLALDGERELYINNDVYVKITRNGPRVINYQKTLRMAAQRGFFKN
jgi:predicted polyphosphate/ATP-dependent NAD kinase